MDLPSGSIESRKFITNVGLITSNGPWGQNIMAAEWTRQVSYEPGIIIINIEPQDATTENIRKSGEFGVNLASETQNVVSSVAGKFTGKEVNKIEILKELGVEFYEGKKIKALMLKNAALNIECRVLKEEQIGDHIMFAGEAVDIAFDETIQPIVYHGGKYWKIGEHIPKPEQKLLDNIAELAEKHRKTS